MSLRFQWKLGLSPSVSALNKGTTCALNPRIPLELENYGADDVAGEW